MTDEAKTAFVGWFREMEKRYGLRELMTGDRGAFRDLSNARRPVGWGLAVDRATRALREVAARHGRQAFALELECFIGICERYAPHDKFCKIRDDLVAAAATFNPQDAGHVAQAFVPPIAYPPSAVPVIASMLVHDATRRKAAKKISLEQAVSEVLAEWWPTSWEHFFGNMRFEFLGRPDNEPVA